MADSDEAEHVRRRLAHRLHDGPIQELTAAQLFLDSLAMRMEAGQADGALRESLERGLSALRNATIGCRQLMDSLRPGLDGQGELAERIRRLAVDAARGEDAEVDVDVPDGFARADAACALAVYRTLEDLLEAVRRGGLRLRCVRVTAGGGRADLSVLVDPATPFDAATEDVAVAAARAARLGGTLEFTDGFATAVAALPSTAGAAEVP